MEHVCRNPDPGCPGRHTPSSLPASPFLTLLWHPALRQSSPTLSPLKTPFPRESRNQVPKLPEQCALFHEWSGWGSEKPRTVGRQGAAVTSRCPRGPGCQDGHRWSGSGLGARGRCSHPWSLSCLVISSLSPCHPSPTPSPAALLSSPRAPRPRPSQPAAQPQNSRGSSQEGPRRLPCSGGEQKGGGRGAVGGRGLGWRGQGWGVSESINHAPLSSCLTHTSPMSCQ